MFVFITIKLSELLWGFKISDDTTGGVYVIYAFSTLELLAELVMIMFAFLYCVFKKGAKKLLTVN
nr:MAG TPA: hypothetical protein [Caudoviricetes sp.]